MDGVEVLAGVDGDGAEALCGWVNARGAREGARRALVMELARGGARPLLSE